MICDFFYWTAFAGVILGLFGMTNWKIRDKAEALIVASLILMVSCDIYDLTHRVRALEAQPVATKGAIESK